MFEMNQLEAILDAESEVTKKVLLELKITG